MARGGSCPCLHLFLALRLNPAFPTAKARRQVARALWDAHASHNRRPLVVIDEAHLLSSAMLEEIRLLTNFHMDSASPMALCLVARPSSAPGSG